MIKNKRAHIVAISSVQGKISIPFRSAYSASKHATQAFFDCLRAEMVPHDIAVTVVSLGYIQTNLSLNAVTDDGSTYGAVLPSMIKNKRGHIVAISSVQGKISIPFRSAYSASKHATQAFFDCLRAEMVPHDIAVTVVSPGYIQTNLSLNAVTDDGSTYGVMDKNTAEGKTPKEVALIVFRAVGERSKDVLVAGLVPTLAVYLRALAPKIFFSIMAARAKKERKFKDA
ncbi:dehydrogenase/reductase SDR family member 7B-like [Phyllobates terribilis]|uniref:dehydrogenase/reductase SDR family member 7B-like n=1 Tax=Phyllobates terribilis TaxID=111132 RepID=UPI003CCB1CD4